MKDQILSYLPWHCFHLSQSQVSLALPIFHWAKRSIISPQLWTTLTAYTKHLLTYIRGFFKRTEAKWQSTSIWALVHSRKPAWKLLPLLWLQFRASAGVLWNGHFRLWYGSHNIWITHGLPVVRGVSALLCAALEENLGKTGWKSKNGSGPFLGYG